MATHLADARDMTPSLERYDNIVVPLDGGPYAERALAPAVTLARRIGASLTVMTVVARSQEAERHEYMERITAGLDVSTHPPYVLVGTDAVECIVNAGEAPTSLLLMTSHARSLATRALLGSVAEGVVRELRRPVVVLGRNWSDAPGWPDGRVVVPLDGSPTAEQIIPAVGVWCRAVAAQPWLTTVTPPTDRAAEPGTETGYLRRLASGLEDAGVPAAWETLVDRSPAGAIAAFATAEAAGLIAMTTHGRTGMARLALGSVAARVLHEAGCPVLLLRPDMAADGARDE